MSKEELEKAFPRLASDQYEISSPKARRYNCIAWAAHDTTRKWDCLFFPAPPRYYWPKGAAIGDGLEHLASAFMAHGYEVCDDESLENGYEKVALYADEDGEWQHAARQLADGRWTSKMGDAEDIIHSTPNGVSESIYGKVSCFMKRPRITRHEKEKGPEDSSQ